MKRYAKALVVVAAVLAAIAKALSDGSVSAEDITVIVGAVVTALGVFFVPNKPAA